MIQWVINFFILFFKHFLVKKNIHVCFSKDNNSNIFYHGKFKQNHLKVLLHTYQHMIDNFWKCFQFSPCVTSASTSKKKSISMDLENVELMQEFTPPKHIHGNCKNELRQRGRQIKCQFSIQCKIQTKIKIPHDVHTWSSSSRTDLLFHF